jgi:hypothetical protein
MAYHLLSFPLFFVRQPNNILLPIAGHTEIGGKVPVTTSRID